jgi:hypothetical protein
MYSVRVIHVTYTYKCNECFLVNCTMYIYVLHVLRLYYMYSIECDMYMYMYKYNVMYFPVTCKYSMCDR